MKSLLRQSNVYDLAAGSLNRYYKRTIMMNEYRAKAALKKNDFKSMAEAKVALENIYKEIDEIIIDIKTGWDNNTIVRLFLQMKILQFNIYVWAIYTKNRGDKYKYNS